MGRDFRFLPISSGLGAYGGTRLPFFAGFLWSRCPRRDETFVFCRFPAVSVSTEGRDFRFLPFSSGLGAHGGTRLSSPAVFQRSRCLRRDETFVSCQFPAVSVPTEGRDFRLLPVSCALGAYEGTRPHRISADVLRRNSSRCRATVRTGLRRRVDGTQRSHGDGPRTHIRHGLTRTHCPN